MGGLRAFGKRLRYALRREKLDRDLEEELQFHLAMKAGQLADEGIGKCDATAAARRSFGNATYLKETSREMFGFVRLELLLADVRYALRTLGRSPGFTVAAVAVLALGLGANTAIFSVVNTVLLKPLPYPHPEELVKIYERGIFDRSSESFPASPRNFLDWQRDAHSFQELAATSYFAANVSNSRDTPEWAQGMACTWNLPHLMGIRPVVGRWFGPNEDRADATPTVIVSYGLWQRQLGGRKDAIGRAIRINGEPTTVIGVLPRGFGDMGESVALLYPLRLVFAPERMEHRGSHSLQVFGRLRTGVRLEQAQAEMELIARGIRKAYPGALVGNGARVVSLHEDGVEGSRTMLITMLAAVGCVLLIACINVGNLLLARASARQRELAIRVALGAGRARLVRQVLAETILLAFGGAIVGLGLGYLLGGALAGPLATAPGADPPAFELDRAILGFLTAISLATALATGLIPAWQTRRTELGSAIREGDQTRTAGRRRGRAGEALVAAQLTISLVLLVGRGCCCGALRSCAG